MRRPRHTLRRFSLALILLICLVVLIGAPYLIDGRYNDLTLRGATVLAASRDSYSLSSPIRLLEAPVIALESGTLSMPPNRTGLARSGEMLAMLVTGKSSRMTLERATFTADFSTPEATFAQGSMQGGVAPLVSAFQKLQFDGLGVRDSAIRIKTADGAILLLDELTADVTAKPDGVIRATGSFVFRGEKVNFDTTLATTADPQSGARPISATLDSELLNAKLEGSYMLGENPRVISPQAELNVPNLRRAARWFGAAWRPGAGFENFRAKGQLEWGNRTVAFQKAVVQLDGNEATGTLSVNFSGTRPAVDGTLGLKTFDASKYLAGDAQPQVSQETKDKDQSFLALVRNADRLEFPLIKTVDADLRLSSDSIVVPGATFGRSAATISLKGGKMLADIAELEIDDGTKAGGQVRIDTNAIEPAYNIRGKFEALDVGRAAQTLFGHPTVQGRGDVTIDISAAGGNGEELLGSLGGKLCVTLNEGGLLGIDVNKLIAAVNGNQFENVWREASSGAISVDKLDARFALAKGTIRTESAEAQSGGRTMKAEGAIDLPRRSIDLELAIGERIEVDPAQHDASIPHKPREVIDMRGPWEEPVVKAGVGSNTMIPAATRANPG